MSALMRLSLLRDQLHQRVRRRLGLPIDLYGAAVEKTELWPSETIEGKRAHVLNGQFDNAIGGGFGRTKEYEIDYLKGGPRRLDPTTMYRFRNVTVDQSWLMTKGRGGFFSWPAKTHLSIAQPRHYKCATIVNSMIGCAYFGHWLRDDCATALLPVDLGPRVIMKSPDWPDKAIYRTLFEQAEPEMLDCAAIDELVYYDDIYQNGFKVPRFEQLRATLRRHVTPQNEGRIVYIRRGPSARHRPFYNEEAVLETLASHGIEIVTPESDTESFISKILDAALVISVEGSQLSHAVYTLRKGGGLLVIQPPDRIFTSHIDWANALGMDIGVIIARQQDDGFTTTAEEILRTVDLF